MCLTEEKVVMMQSYCKSDSPKYQKGQDGSCNGRKSLPDVDFKLQFSLILPPLYSLTIGSYISERSSRYEACGKFGGHERCVRALELPL